MSATGLRTFDSTIQKTNIWLDDIMDELNTDSRQRAYHALGAVLHTLRDHLPVNESAQLAAELPQMIRGLYYEGWVPSAAPAKLRHWDEFVSRVAAGFPMEEDDNPDQMTRAVLRSLTKHISHGEIIDIKRCLTDEIRQHWK